MKQLCKLLVAGGIFHAVIFSAGSGALAATKYSDGSQKLSGSWECRGAAGQTMLKFVDDEFFDYNGEQTTFTIVPGAIRVQGPYGPVNYYYVFRGDTLVIAFPDGSRISCSKIAEGPAR
ncbi:MAG: hypothetical protein HY789_14815 [Deltaproteobacteria bacterium]|nr:hypothetical protein [Deltaproteobacteria bacterium]